MYKIWCNFNLLVFSEVVEEEIVVEDLGCWTDTSNRAIPNVFMNHPENTIADCQAAAVENGLLLNNFQI